MRTSDDGKWRGNIRYYDTYGKLMKWDIDGPEDVEDAIQEAQMRITGNQRNVSKSIIEMTLESPELPNLTLIDLPGIARQTDIIKEYIRREETIILVVIPLTSDTATMEALQLAKDADPYGMRTTIGVLTFPDLVNKGAQEEKLMIARNITYPLSKGYVTVKCRNQEDIKNRKSLKDAKADEALFFNTDPKFIPELISDVQSVRERLGQELAQMGKGPPEDDRSKVALIARMFNDFTKLFEKEASGKSHNFQEDSGKKNLHQRCRQHWCHLAEQMEKTVRQIGDDDAKKFAKAVRDFLDDQRGRELPNFQSAYPVIECIIRQRLVAPLRQLAMHCLRDVSVEVDDTLRDLADSVFTSYPRLDQYVKESVQGIKERMYSRAKDDLDRQFDQESYVWTSDLTFDDESNRREATRSLVMNVMVLLPNRNMYSFTEQFNRQSVEWIADHCCRPEDESNTEFAAWFQGIFQQYFSQSSASQDEKASGPKSPRDADHEPDEAIERSPSPRMIDNAPLCMMHFMLYKLADELCNEVSIFQQESEKLDQLLEEKEGIRIHRIETKKPAESSGRG
uniref:Dynamin-type G domain-containing protein n=1 Tax=Macrostomum lignano TaxID=282301 RepID=A0A1I8FTG1_9PLAT